MWPRGTELAPDILDELGKEISGKRSLRAIARGWQPEELSVEALLDNMLLLLHRCRRCRWMRVRAVCAGS